MKKLLLLSALTLSLAAQARQLTFYVGETALKPGDKYVFTDITKEPAGAGFDVVMAPELYLHSDIVTSNVNITAECVSGQSVQMCAGGDCMSGTTIKKTGVRVGTDEKLPLEFEYMTYTNDLSSLPVVTTNFTAVDPKYPNTQVTLTVEMNPGAGVGSVTISATELTMVDGGLNYNVSGPSTLALIDITGRTVLRRDINGEGFISTAGLARGLYIYRIAGRSSLSGKIQLR